MMMMHEEVESAKETHKAGRINVSQESKVMTFTAGI